MQRSQSIDDTHSLAREFRAFIERPEFPCVGAKSALARGTLKIVVARDIRSAWNDVQIHDELLGWAYQYRDDPSGLRSLAVVFETAADLSEDELSAACGNGCSPWPTRTCGAASTTIRRSAQTPRIRISR
jgi:FPC/CPF motif-containing protein YcgG